MASTTYKYNTFVIKVNSPWRVGTKTWSMRFALSGAALTSQATAQATAQAICNVLRQFNANTTTYTDWLYYAPGSTVNTYQGTFPGNANQGNEAFYQSQAESDPQQLEVCALLRAPVGTNSKGRAKYLFKYVHGVFAGSSPDLLAPNVGAAQAGLTAFSTGLGPNNLVTVSPSTGAASGAWTVDAGLYTRQLRSSGKKAKA